jgi:hypothetical protein
MKERQREDDPNLIISVVLNNNVELTILIVIYGPFCIVIGEKVASFFCY